MERAFGFQPHADKGHNAVEAMEAIIAGESKALICLVGNLPVAMSDHLPLRECEGSILLSTSQRS